MSAEKKPALSVVIVADRYATIRKTVRHLVAQTIADRLELVIVVPRGEEIGLDERELAGLAGHRVVRMPTIESLARARAPGVRAATAPVVALAESHCFPEPAWAEALLRRHGEGWAAVGAAIRNANPDGVVSWINLFLDYGPWLAPTPGGELRDLPGHNSSYRREILLAYGERLEELLEVESLMHEDLRSQGHRLYQEPRATAAHLNVTRLGTSLGERFMAGRRFAAARAASWSPLRRGLYAAGSPLIPLVRFPRLLGDRRRAGLCRELPERAFPVLALALAVSAAGEAAGYALGPGGSIRALSRIELHKERHVRRPEREAAAP